jgi:hypothetical protein|nr:MAG TPA: hypothetical protein [Caudoviricetes sp.]
MKYSEIFLKGLQVLKYYDLTISSIIFAIGLLLFSDELRSKDFSITFFFFLLPIISVCFIIDRCVHALFLRSINKE